MSMSLLVIDLGLSGRFEASLDYARALAKSTQGGEDLGIDVEYIRTRNRLSISAALLSAATVIHVMGHGEYDLSPAIVSEGGEEYRALDQRALQIELDVWPQAHCLILDACNTWTDGWREAIANCLLPRQELLLIGSNRSISWAEATLFTSNFYAAAMRAGLTGNLRHDWRGLQRSCEAAVEAYETLAHESTPFEFGWVEGVS